MQSHQGRNIHSPVCLLLTIYQSLTSLLLLVSLFLFFWKEVFSCCLRPLPTSVPYLGFPPFLWNLLGFGWFQETLRKEFSLFSTGTVQEIFIKLNLSKGFHVKWEWLLVLQIQTAVSWLGRSRLQPSVVFLLFQVLLILLWMYLSLSAYHSE